MCTYCSTNNYRKIYENHIGPIPRESNGRTYDVHHIDGNRNNNSIENLIALSIQEHYDLHLTQKDYGACLRLAEKMQLSPQILSELASKQQKDRASKGIHPWQGSQVAIDRNTKRLSENSHNFAGVTGSNHATQHNKKMLETGSHPSQILIGCLCCRKSVSTGMFRRWHGDKCKQIIA